MPTLKELAATVGLVIEKDEDLTVDAFRDHVSKTYTPTESILKDEKIKKQIVGKVLGSLSTKLAQEFELTSGEIAEKPMEEIFSMVKGKYKAQIDDLTTKATSGNDEKVSKLTEDLGKVKERLKIAEGGLVEKDTKYKTDSEKWAGDLKTYKLNDKLNKAKSGLEGKFTDDYTKNELVKTGFNARISEKYVIDLDEKDELAIYDAGTKELVKSKITSGVPAKFEEVLQMEAEAAGVWKKNNAKGDPIIKTQTKQQPEGKVLNPIHPNALARTVKQPA